MSGLGNYDGWKLATPPEYDRIGGSYDDPDRDAEPCRHGHPAEDCEACNPYVVSIADRAGPWASTHFATFDEALAYRDEAARIYPAKVVQISNQERVDEDFDGLTDDERERL